MTTAWLLTWALFNADKPHGLWLWTAIACAAIDAIVEIGKQAQT